MSVIIFFLYHLICFFYFNFLVCICYRIVETEMSFWRNWLHYKVPMNMIDHFKWCCSVGENVFEFHRSPVNSTHKGQWRGALMFCLICTCWVNNRDAGDLGRHLAHYDVTVMKEACGACAHPDGLAPLGNETSAYRHCDGQVSTLLHGSLIMAWIKWPSFCRRFFQVQFFFN